jgi:hypothetical protein
MVLWCTIHCVNCECSLFLSVLCGCALSPPEHDKLENTTNQNMTEMSVGYLCVCTPIP